MSKQNSSEEMMEQFIRELELVNGEAVLVKPKEMIECVKKIIKKENIKELMMTNFQMLKKRELIEEIEKQNVKVYEIEKIDSDKFNQKLKKADAGITGSELGISETGSILIITTSRLENLVSQLPRVHIAFLKKTKIVKTVKEISTVLKEKNQNMNKPFTATMITGPSRSADIEKIITLGIHGPLKLYVIII